MFLKFLIVIVLASFCDGQGDISWSESDDLFVNDIKCVPILECPEAMEILRHKPLTAAKREHLKSIKCGQGAQYPLVWCAILKTNITTDSRIVIPERPSFLPRPSESECGFSEDGNKIQGGENTSIGEFPWMAWLEYRTRDRQLSGKCAGTLITNRYVLTAAHCVVVTANAGKLESVLLGEYDTSNETDCTPNPWTGTPDCADLPKRFGIEESSVHPLYMDSANAKLYHHDIALLRLSEEAVYTTYIKPICLPEPKADNNIGFFMVAGWGKTETGKPSNILQKLRLPRFDTEQCTQVLQYNVTDAQVCAGGEEKKDSCKGDSGGPLMYLSSQFQLWTQMGIISIRIGNRCGVGIPAIYTDVQKHIGWIYENLKP